MERVRYKRGCILRCELDQRYRQKKIERPFFNAPSDQDQFEEAFWMQEGSKLKDLAL
jgi:hypothetical protein